MLRQIGSLIALGGVLLAGREPQQSILHTRREASSDLEVTGQLRGVPAGESRFVSRESLLGLPQVEASIPQSEELSDKAGVELAAQGIYLDDLVKILGGEGDAAAGICKDGYTSTFPVDYIKAHRPILVLTIEGMTPHEWATKNSRFDASPYLVGYHDFVPAFRVLSHADQPAQPDGMTKMVFGTDQQLYDGIVPIHVAAPNDTLISDGYTIARQNCYRCHNAGANGGTKAGVSWAHIGGVAKKKPAYFAAWVRHPQAVKPNAKMPPNLDYDGATLAALQHYFATFAVEGE